ncbi:MAG: type IV pilus inner membrane component PilO [Candidatus Geothermincolia bacterium]
MLRRPAIALLIALFIAIVVGAAGYFLLVGPKKGKVDTVQKEIEATNAKIQQEKSTFKQLSDIKNRSAEFEAKLASLQAKIPQQSELPSLIRNIQTAADVKTGAGLPWLSFSPKDLTAGTGGVANSYLFDMRVAGFYDQVVDLIYRLERMERAIVVNTVNMSPTSSILDLPYSPNFGLVQCDITAKTFTFASPAGTSAAPTTAPTPQTTPGSSPTTAPAP